MDRASDNELRRVYKMRRKTCGCMTAIPAYIFQMMAIYTQMVLEMLLEAEKEGFTADNEPDKNKSAMLRYIAEIASGMAVEHITRCEQSTEFLREALSPEDLQKMWQNIHPEKRN